MYRESCIVNHVLLCALCILLVFSFGCALLIPMQRGKVLAVVEDDPITEEDLTYALQIAHRREDLSGAGTIDLEQYLKKLIDDRLIIHEAYHMGLDQDPYVRQATDAYILRESVRKLYDEEITRKIDVSKDDVMNYYNQNYQEIHIGLIQVRTKEGAQEVLKKLHGGTSFEELAKRYSIHPSKGKGGDIETVKYGLITPIIKEAISNLKIDEVSSIIKNGSGYYVVKLKGRKEPAKEKFGDIKMQIEKKLLKEKEKGRSNEYLRYLRNKARINIDRKLLSSINIEKLGQYLYDSRPLVKINGTILTVGEFSQRIRSALSKRGVVANEKLKENIMNDWIDYKLVDNEALTRHYENEPELGRQVRRYKGQLLKNIFSQKAIMPKINLLDEILKDYYVKNQKKFVKPIQFKLRQITVKTIDDAQEMVDQLKNGADFAWLAKRHSIDSAASKGGAIGWLSRDEFPEPLRKIIDDLKVGDIGPIVKIDSGYILVRLDGRSKEEVEEFDDIKDRVKKVCFEAQYNKIFKEYVDRLKIGVRIEVNRDAIHYLEEKLHN